MKTPIILARQDKRSDPTTMLPSPGAVSIMQRESSGSHLPTSPPMHASTSSSTMFQGDHLPPSSSTHHVQSIPQVLKPHDEGKSRNQRRQDNMSSSPSSYTPLQPGTRGGARGENSGGHMRTMGDHFAQSSEMNHCIKMINRNLHWDDKGEDVRQ